jgi:hypothetical protein
VLRTAVKEEKEKEEEEIRAKLLVEWEAKEDKRFALF